MLKLTLQILRYGINFVAVVVLLAVALASPEAVQAHYDVIPLVGDVRWLGGRWPQLLLCVWVAFLYGLSHGLARLVVRLGGGPWVRWFVELLRAVPGGWLTKVGWALFLSKEELVRTPLVYVVREAARGRQGPSVEAVVEAVVDTVKTTVETITGSWTPYLVGGAVAVTIIYVVIKILTGGGGGGAGGPTVGEVRHEAAAALQEAQPAVPQAVPEAVQEAAAAVAGGFGLYGVVRRGLSLLRTFFWGETPLPPVQEEPVVEQPVVEAQPVMEAQPLPVVEDVEDLVNMGRFYVFCGVIYEVIRQLRLQQLLDPLGLVAYLPPVRLGSLRSLRLWQPLVRLWRRPPGAKAQAPGQAVEQPPVQEDPVVEQPLPVVEQPPVVEPLPFVWDEELQRQAMVLGVNTSIVLTVKFLLEKYPKDTICINFMKQELTENISVKSFVDLCTKSDWPSKDLLVSWSKRISSRKKALEKSQQLQEQLRKFLNELACFFAKQARLVCEEIRSDAKPNPEKVRFMRRLLRGWFFGQHSLKQAAKSKLFLVKVEPFVNRLLALRIDPYSLQAILYSVKVQEYLQQCCPTLSSEEVLTFTQKLISVLAKITLQAKEADNLGDKECWRFFIHNGLQYHMMDPLMQAEYVIKTKKTFASIYCYELLFQEVEPILDQDCVIDLDVHEVLQSQSFKIDFVDLFTKTLKTKKIDLEYLKVPLEQFVDEHITFFLNEYDRYLERWERILREED